MLDKNDAEILNSIYKNSRMAYDSTKQVAAKCSDTGLKDYLERQMRHYADNCRNAAKELNAGGAAVGKIPAMQRAMAHIGIAMKTMRDRSGSNIAELMYDGTNMGIVDIARTVNRSHNASAGTIQRAEALLGEEEKYADGLRKFL